MAEALDGLTPISLRLAVEALPRRALQSLAKKQGVKANQKSDVLARQLFERFLAEGVAHAGGGSEDSEVPCPAAGVSAGALGVAQGSLSPVSEGACYSVGVEQEREGSVAAQHSVSAPSPLPDGLAFNPLFGQDASHQQEAAAGVPGKPAVQEQPAEQQESGAAPPPSARRVKLVKRERCSRAAAADRASGQLHVVGSKRKASAEAPQEAALPAAKRQAHKSSGAEPGAKVAGPVAAKPTGKLKPAAAAKPASKPAVVSKPSMPAALKAANGPRPGPATKNPSGDTVSQGQVPPAKPASGALASSTSVAERARLAEERHAARRTAALARAGILCTCKM